ncbi:transporter substrate-binding domain-containing protein [Pseudomonas putida]|uniref:transporter substrate-binding domain-containing protein n=1 Tax=Pseudomonas putida TaxID=303 RepID=UPI00383B816E
MNTPSIVRWAMYALLTLLATSTQLQAQPEVRLLVRTPLTASHGTFDAQTQAWLDTRTAIRVAYWDAARPPLHVNYDPGSFEGVTADMLGVLQQILGVPVEMHRFRDRAAAQQAMAEDKVDLLGLNDTSEPTNSLFTASNSYLLNNKVTIRRINDPINPGADLSGERVAYLATTAEHLQRIQAQYPNSQLLPFSRHMTALAALAYNQVDAFRTNGVTAEYLLPNFQRKNLYVVEEKGAPRVANINFAVSNQHPLLLKAINQALLHVPDADMLRISSNWGLNPDFVIARKSLELMPEQNAWIAAHRTLKVAVVGTYAPLTFQDERNRLSGLSADVLRVIERMTGLEVKAVYCRSIMEMVQKLNAGDVDLIAALNVGELRLQPEQYTRPYLDSPFVIVTRRAEADIRSPEELNGMRMALPWGNPLTESIKQRYPQIQLVSVRHATEGLEKLAAGEVEAAVHTQFEADYFISHHFQADLHIASVIGAQPARVAMAVGQDKAVLKDIVNAALLEIRPDELRALVDRWGVHEPPAVASSWRTYKDVVYTVIGAAAIFALVFLVWNQILRTNIQKRQKAERDLEDQLRFTKTLIDEAPVALYVRDQKARLVQCNQAYLNFFDLSRDTVIGKTLLDSRPFDDALNARAHNAYLNALKTGQSVFADIDVDANGTSHRVYHWILPFQDSQGTYIGVIGGWLDITEREHLMEQLNKAKESAVNANRSKSVFLASMSHEIRTPVSALAGLLELLRLEAGNTEARESLDVAHKTAQSLLSLVGDILDLSKIEAGEMVPSPQPTDLVAMAQSIHGLFKPNADSKQLDYQLVLELQNHGILIDKVMLGQVVSNLLSNAIKFTSRGSVQLLLRELPGASAPDRARYAVQVSDTGTGLTPSQCHEIFEPFVQANPHAHRVQGTGLGLSICTSLAKLLGAQLSVDSQPGMGSRFTLTFEAEIAPLAPSSTSPAPLPLAARRLRVLVAEDHAANRLMLCKQLEYLGHEAVPCEDGETALEHWLHAETPFDLTITDCSMEHMDGYALARAMREVEFERAIALHPIYGLTANAMPEIKQRCLDAGMNQCLFKPLSIDALATLLNEVAQTTERRARAAQSTGSELDKLRLLSPESYSSLVQALVQAHQESASELIRLTQNRDTTGAGKVAHKIRGGAQLAGDQDLIEACRALEALAPEAELQVLKACVEQVLALSDALEQRLKEAS